MEINTILISLLLWYVQLCPTLFLLTYSHLSLTIACLGMVREEAECCLNPSVNTETRSSTPSSDLLLIATYSFSQRLDLDGLKLNKMGITSLQQTFSFTASWYLAKIDPTPKKIIIITSVWQFNYFYLIWYNGKV